MEKYLAEKQAASPHVNVSPSDEYDLSLVAKYDSDVSDSGLGSERKKV